jgi:hypothetical protein
MNSGGGARNGGRIQGWFYWRRQARAYVEFSNPKKNRRYFDICSCAPDGHANSASCVVVYIDNARAANLLPFQKIRWFASAGSNIEV